MTLLRVLLPILVLFSAVVPSSPAAAELDCPSIGQLAREFLKHHVVQSALGTDLEQRAIESYLHRLDTSRSLMLDSEVAELHAKLAGVFENLQAGNCSQITAVHERLDRKSTRLNSSHLGISYAVFCLKKKTKN